MILDKNMVFRDSVTGEVHPVLELPKKPNNLVVGTYYIIGSLLYKYVGEVPSKIKFHEEYGVGTIASVHGKMYVKEWESDDDKDRFSSTYIMRYDDNDIFSSSKDFTAQLLRYKTNYDEGYNLAVNTNRVSRNSNTGFYKPDIKEDDFALDILIKKLIQSMKIVSSEKRNVMTKEYSFDNLVSTLGYGTQHLSITKFLEWVDLLGLEWEFSIYDNDPMTEYPLSGMITVTNTDSQYREITEVTDKGIFKVPLVDTPKDPYSEEPYNPYKNEDPYKRLIKIALDEKNIPSRLYNSPASDGDQQYRHLINNMKSAIKTKQKMTSKYFNYWCNALNMSNTLILRDPKTGIWYQATNSEITTNYVDPEEGKDEGFR